MFRLWIRVRNHVFKRRAGAIAGALPRVPTLREQAIERAQGKVARFCDVIVLLLLLFSPQVRPESESEESRRLSALIRDVEQSGRVLTLVREADDGMRLAPGAPPLLAFRYLDGRQRGRFGGLDLVLDDAGH